jgi:hypothetical protein
MKLPKLYLFFTACLLAITGLLTAKTRRNHNNIVGNVFTSTYKLHCTVWGIVRDNGVTFTPNGVLIITTINRYTLYTSTVNNQCINPLYLGNK